MLRIIICFLIYDECRCFFDASVIDALKNDSSSNSIVVDVGRYMEESMKVIEKNGRLVSISKQISFAEALGCSIDVYKFGKDGGTAFYKKCIEYIEEKNELKKWSEVALNEILKDVEFRVCPLNGRWVEVDNLEDLKVAEEMFICKK